MHKNKLLVYKSQILWTHSLQGFFCLLFPSNFLFHSKTSATSKSWGRTQMYAFCKWNLPLVQFRMERYERATWYFFRPPRLVQFSRSFNPNNHFNLTFPVFQHQMSDLYLLDPSASTKLGINVFHICWCFSASACLTTTKRWWPWSWITRIHDYCFINSLKQSQPIASVVKWDHAAKKAQWAEREREY